MGEKLVCNHVLRDCALMHTRKGTGLRSQGPVDLCECWGEGRPEPTVPYEGQGAGKELWRDVRLLLSPGQADAGCMNASFESVNSLRGGKL